MNKVAAALLAVVTLSAGASALAQGTLERVAQRNELRIGYRTDARPLSFEENGSASGYSVDICRHVAVGVREHLELPDMKVTFVPVTIDSRFDALVDGDIDIECGATTITLTRQETVDFSLMTFVTGGTILSTAENRVGTMAELEIKHRSIRPGSAATA